MRILCKWNALYWIISIKFKFSSNKTILLLKPKSFVAFIKTWLILRNIFVQPKKCFAAPTKYFFLSVPKYLVGSNKWFWCFYSNNKICLGQPNFCLSNQTFFSEYNFIFKMQEIQIILPTLLLKITKLFLTWVSQSIPKVTENEWLFWMINIWLSILQ